MGTLLVFGASAEVFLSNLKSIRAIPEENLADTAKRLSEQLNRGLSIPVPEGKKPMMVFSTSYYDPDSHEIIEGKAPEVYLRGDPSLKPILILEELPYPIPDREKGRLEESYDIVSKYELYRRYTNHFRQEVVGLRAGICSKCGPTYLNNCCPE